MPKRSIRAHSRIEAVCSARGHFCPLALRRFAFARVEHRSARTVTAEMPCAFLLLESE